MRKILLSLVALFVASLLVSACDAPASPYAAVVSGRVISRSSLNELLSAATSDSGFGCEITNGNSTPIAGAGNGTYSIAVADELLTLLIERQTLVNEAAHLHLPPSSLARRLATQQIEQSLTPSTSSSSGETCTESGATVVEHLPSGARRELVDLWAAEDRLGAHLAGVSLSPQALSSFADAHPNLLDETCASVIVVSSKTKATSLYDDLKAGADFATVAEKNSTDATSAKQGGAIGCVEPDQFSGTLASTIEALPNGGFSTPIDFEGSYVILRVTSRTAPNALEAAGAVVGLKASKLSSLINTLSSKDAISVDPSYGTWTKTTSGYAVSGPKVPAESLLMNPAAVAPGGLSISTS